LFLAGFFSIVNIGKDFNPNKRMVTMKDKECDYQEVAWKSTGYFDIYKNNEEFRMEDFERLSQELLDILFLVCEAHRHGQGKRYAKALPLAAMAVQESIRTFLALLKRK
jgi:hypothetical protein